MNAFWIRAKERTVEAVEYGGLHDLQRMVAAPDQNARGTICLAGYLKGDTVYVNDEGLFLFHDFFNLAGCGQGLFAGNAVIVGKEIGDTSNTRSPKSTLSEVTSAVSFLDRWQARVLANKLGI